MTAQTPSRTVGSVDYSELRAYARAQGSHWFAPDTMKLWRCRLLGTPSWRDWDGRAVVMFITSDAPGTMPRRYSVRAFQFGADLHRTVLTVSGYAQFKTAAEARNFLNTFPRR